MVVSKYHQSLGVQLFLLCVCVCVCVCVYVCVYMCAGVCVLVYTFACILLMKALDWIEVSKNYTGYLFQPSDMTVKWLSRNLTKFHSILCLQYG